MGKVSSAAERGVVDNGRWGGRGGGSGGLPTVPFLLAMANEGCHRNARTHLEKRSGCDLQSALAKS